MWFPDPGCFAERRDSLESEADSGGRSDFSGDGFSPRGLPVIGVGFPLGCRSKMRMDRGASTSYANRVLRVKFLFGTSFLVVSVPVVWLLAEADDFFQAAVVEAAVGVGDGIKTPALARGSQIVDGEERFGVEDLGTRVEHVGDSQHGGEVEIFADGGRGSEISPPPPISLGAFVAGNIDASRIDRG